MKYVIFLLIMGISHTLLASEKKYFIEWNSALLDTDANVAKATSLAANAPLFLTLDVKKFNIDFQKHNLFMQLMLSNLSATKGMEIRFLEERNSKNYFYYNFPMFEDFDFNLFKENSWQAYGLSKANLSIKNETPKKINFITFYLMNNHSPVSLSIRDLKVIPRPKRGILSFTFDDGPKSNLLAAKILKTYQQKATAYIMPKGTMDGVKRLTPKEMMSLKTKYHWHIDSHHSKPFTIFTENNLEKEMINIQTYLKQNTLKQSSFHLAYPLGKTTTPIRNLTKKYFSTARLAGGGIETLPPADLMAIRSYNVLNTTTPEELKKIIEIVRDSGQWIILMFHEITDAPKNELEYSKDNLEKLAKIIHESKIDVLTIEEVWEKYLK